MWATLQAKLIALGLVLALGLSGGWFFRGWKSSGTINKLKGDIELVTLERDTCQGFADSLTTQLSDQTSINEQNEASLKKLRDDAVARDAASRKAIEDISRYRLENTKLRLELAKPLPSGLEEAILETARRVL